MKLATRTQLYTHTHTHTCTKRVTVSPPFSTIKPQRLLLLLFLLRLLLVLIFDPLLLLLARLRLAVLRRGRRRLLGLLGRLLGRLIVPFGCLIASFTSSLGSG